MVHYNKAKVINPGLQLLWSVLFVILLWPFSKTVRFFSITMFVSAEFYILILQISQCSVCVINQIKHIQFVLLGLEMA